MKKNIIGKLIVILQIIVSSTFFLMLHWMGLMPKKIEQIICIFIVGINLISLILQFTNGLLAKIFKAINIFLIIAFVLGTYEVAVADKALNKISEVNTSINNMVVVVRKDDSAKSLDDTKTYLFGVQSAEDRENLKLMLKQIKSAFKTPVKKETYNGTLELANALLKGNIGAAIYDEAFSDILEENIDGYKDKVRVIYKYSVKKNIKEIKINKPILKKKDLQSFNIYISGIDVSGPIQTRSRSDVNIIVTLNTKTHEVLLTSTPRDYYVTIPEITGENRDKLTHAGIYGVDASMRTLENLYGIDIPYYTRVNFTSLIKLVDIIGGIDVESDYDFTSLHGGYHFIRGINHMNGKQALGFCRERYSFAEGDRQRGKNQEKVITAIIQKILNPNVLKNSNDIIIQMSDSMQMNIPQETIRYLLNNQMEEGGSWAIKSQSVTGKGDSTTCFSMGSAIVYVMKPDKGSVDKASSVINNVLICN